MSELGLDVTKDMSTIDKLAALQACDEATDWVTQSGVSDPETLWKTCPRGDWLLWLAVKAGVDRRLVVKACCDIALAVRHIAPDDPRIDAAIDTAEAFCSGEATAEECRLAAYAAAATAAYIRNEPLASIADLVRSRIPWSAVSDAMEDLT